MTVLQYEEMIELEIKYGPAQAQYIMDEIARAKDMSTQAARRA